MPQNNNDPINQIQQQELKKFLELEELKNKLVNLQKMSPVDIFNGEFKEVLNQLIDSINECKKSLETIDTSMFSEKEISEINTAIKNIPSVIIEISSIINTPTSKEKYNG